MNISDEALEAAALAWCGSTDLLGWQRRHICKLLEAAAPHLMAAAWDEGWYSDEGLEANPYWPSTNG